jgi:hypothetical protein
MHHDRPTQQTPIGYFEQGRDPEDDEVARRYAFILAELERAAVFGLSTQSTEPSQILDV